ncbi:MAG: ATP synthase F1 subunit gamma [bacterium]|nr:ATP synthase F1 subunit gamma [bacterium]
MSSTKAVKQRIKSVKNTAQITKAMEVVSATKMRRSQEFAIRARPFAVASLELLTNVLKRSNITPDLFTSREVKTTAIVMVASDKGLAGAFNSNVIKKTESLIQEKQKTGNKIAFVTVGKKAKDYAERRNMTVAKNFSGFGDYTTIEETLEVADSMIHGFLDGSFDEVIVVYTHFRTTLQQETIIKKILPATEASLADSIQHILPEYGKFSEKEKPLPHERYNYEYKFEPSAKDILDTLIPQLIRIHIHHVLLESNASEHSARMVAMKSASDNAKDLIGTLTLAYNKARQASITQELTEITAGREALEG